MSDQPDGGPSSEDQKKPEKVTYNMTGFVSLNCDTHIPSNILQTDINGANSNDNEKRDGILGLQI